MAAIPFAIGLGLALPSQHQHHPPATPPAKPAQHQHTPPKPPAKPPAKPQSPQHEQHQHGQHGAMGHMGVLGPWPMYREASGTSWIPDSSPMFMKMLPSSGPWELALMGFAMLNYADAGGPRGDEQFFSSSMIMLHGTRPQGEGKFGFRVMVSLDPFNGKRGYPNLFQTGETAGGSPLKDRQHPHDLLSELSLQFSQPLSANWNGFLYLAPIGEPAIGNAPFAHRPSGMENAESPISHHWFDGTHITYGVVTAGLAFRDKWKLDASAFKGREPDEDRFDIDPIRLDSLSGRITHNPTRDLSWQASYAYLKEPETLEPGEDQNRITASATYNRPTTRGDWATTALWGRNIKRAGGPTTDALLLETALIHERCTLFGRWERVEKDELVDVPPGVYEINKFTLGGVRNFAKRDGFVIGIGAYVDFYKFPESLEPFYGKSPVSFGIYLRVRPEKMSTGGH